MVLTDAVFLELFSLMQLEHFSIDLRRRNIKVLGVPSSKILHSV
jgi:hypothetical protein